ncbi:hypothetical protein SASPL_132094 [Salvia splendens]|uniref:Uncharacterized protein n=1 Tax=Salvia splendens TaxID=180675 RepID=A0A8X8ZLK8_SALSN|nr:hypothetical protein SASPL_132046 [Salvia splendens]KAG6409063.1 hypothetical protein SASPL_132094 [Salvia splendens]
MIRAHSEAVMYEQNQHLVNTEAEVERMKQRRREIDGLVPMQMGDLNLEQLGLLWNTALMINGEFEAAKQMIFTMNAPDEGNGQAMHPNNGQQRQGNGKGKTVTLNIVKETGIRQITFTKREAGIFKNG